MSVDGRHWSVVAREYAAAYAAAAAAGGGGPALWAAPALPVAAAPAEPDWLLYGAKLGNRRVIEEATGDALATASVARAKVRAAAERAARRLAKRNGTSGGGRGPARRVDPPDALPVRFARARTSLALWRALRDEGAASAAARRAALARLAELLGCEASNNSTTIIDALSVDLAARPDEAASAAIEARLAPLFEDAVVGAAFADDRGDGDVVVLFRIPEDGEDEALYVYGACLREAECARDGTVQVFPRWAVSEWDASDLAAARPPRAAPPRAPRAPRPFEPGDAVRVRWRGGPKLFAAFVDRVLENGHFDVSYDDGDREAGVPGHLIQKRRGRPPSPDKTTRKKPRLSTRV